MMTGESKERGSRERGATIVLVALAMTALLSVVALAIDIGMLLNSRSEAQRAADAGAMAGAQSLIPEPTDADRAEDFAIEFGEKNNVFDELASIQPQDVDVDTEDGRVTVRVRREAARGNAVETWFANVFGVSDADVGAVATAQVRPAGGAACVKPWAIPDAWDDANGDEGYDPGEFYQADMTGWGTDYRDTGEPGEGQMPDGFGITYDDDRGRQVRISEGDPDETVESGWYFPWDIPQPPGGVCSGGPGGQGGSCYEWAIANCHPQVIELGAVYKVENGRMVGPMNKGISDLMALDPNAQWDPSTNTVVNSQYTPWEGTPRKIVVPFYDPTLFPLGPGKEDIVFNNFGEIFIEGKVGNDIMGRFMGYAVGVGGNTGPTVPGLQFVQVVE
jgi:Flp pilus assembly protein TadG